LCLLGNIVSEQPRLVRDQIFDQLYQQASTNSMVNYDQGQYPVIPPIEGSPHYMQYTNAAIQPVINQQQQQPPPPPQQVMFCRHNTYIHIDIDVVPSTKPYLFTYSHKSIDLQESLSFLQQNL
jgi:hypothetical protein